MGEQQTWVVAVSGGIDSVVLLDILHKHSKARLIVAHVDHGIRDDGDEDLIIVQKHAAARNLHLECTKLKLGADCSEQAARTARYAWLQKIVDSYHADKLVTAHHQDDVLETIVINHIRGTGWRGLASLRSHDQLFRPLLHMSKARIIAYAIHHCIEWREDSTNDDVRYLRNAVRLLIIPRMSSEQRRQLLSLYEKQTALIHEYTHEVDQLSRHMHGRLGMSRYWLIMVDASVAMSCIEHELEVRLQRPHAKQLLHFARSSRAGSDLQLPNGIHVRATADELIVSHR